MSSNDIDGSPYPYQDEALHCNGDTSQFLILFPSRTRTSRRSPFHTRSLFRWERRCQYAKKYRVPHFHRAINSPCPPPPVGPCYEDEDCYPPPQEKPVKQSANKRCDDDQCPPPPPVFRTQVRQCDVNGVILHFDGNGLLRDQLSRIGYIADNFQFQFDLPVQSGGYGEKEFGEYKDPKTGDVFLTWRGSPDFYKCRSGNFHNLYSQSIGAQCEVTRIMVFHCVVP